MLKWTFAALLLGACGPEVHYETVEEDAQRLCENVSTCNQLPDPSEHTERCVNALLDESEIGLEEGSRCAEGFSRLLSCMSLLSCDQLYVEWSSNYAVDDNPVDYPCKSETLVLLRECDRTWHAIND